MGCREAELTLVDIWTAKLDHIEMTYLKPYLLVK